MIFDNFDFTKVYFNIFCVNRQCLFLIYITIYGVSFSKKLAWSMTTNTSLFQKHQMEK